MSFHNLPDEVLRNLLFYLDPADTLERFQFIDHRAARLVRDPLLWRYHCFHGFKLWDSSHEIAARTQRPVSEFDWKRLFIQRTAQNAYVAQLFEEILVTRLDRWAKIEEICDLGYDAKEFLIEQCNAPESSEDALARRYWARAILDTLHKNIAIQQWGSMLAGSHKPDRLEAVLASFDLFVIGTAEGDHYDISRMLDERAAEFLASAPQFQSWSTREKAASLNRWLRAQNLTGMRNPQADYRNLRNCLIGQALRHPDHESIPIISSAIFTCIARRLGLAAGCCGLPTHVHVVVFPPAGQTLDGDPRGVLANDEELSKMYFDPWGNDDEIPVERLKTFLSQFGFQSATRSALAMMSDAAVVGRIAGNINETNNLFLENQPAMDDVTPRHDYSQLLDGHGWPIMAASHYASLWSNLLLSQPTHFEWVRHLAGLLDHVSRTYPEDCWLIERYLMPAYDGLGTMRHLDVRAEPRNLLRLIRRTSEARAPVYQRLESENGTEVYRVGDVFRHRRYGYFGIITGWSSQATRKLTIPSTIMEQAQSSARDPRSVTRMMDRLETDDKTYYTYMRQRTSEKYTASEDYLEIIRDAELIQEHKFLYAGKYFKRFDPEACRFISNIREEFPDD